MSNLKVCHYCQGRREFPDGSHGHPWGWYALSVNVPPEMGKNGQPFLWVGVWCSMECLAADIPALAGQEELARMAYEADAPDYPASTRGRTR